MVVKIIFCFSCFSFLFSAYKLARKILKNEDGSVMTAVKNNFLQFRVEREDGSVRYMLVKEQALADTISSLETAKFIFDHQNVIVGIE